MRYTIFVIILVAHFFLGLVASTVPVSEQQAEEFRTILPENPTALDIFENNFRIALYETVPAAGLGVMVFAMWTTGLVFSALGPSSALQAPGPIAWLFVSIFPFFWLELISYSLAVTAGIMLLLSALFDRKHFTHELGRTAITIPTCAFILWNAAVNELLQSAEVIMLTWVPLVAATTLAIHSLSLWYGLRLTNRDWVIIGAPVISLALYPPIYVFSTSLLLLSKLRRNRTQTATGTDLSSVPSTAC